MRRLLLAALAIALLARAATAQSGFVASFTADDRIGGSEMRVLAAHGGRLFAGNGYWEDRVGEGRQGAQILVLDRPDGRWQIDHSFDDRMPRGRARALAVSALRDVIFATDAAGRRLSAPVSLLVASVWDLTGMRTIYTRDDTTGAWTGDVLARDSPRPDFLPQIRSLASHRDRATGVDRIFAGDSRGVFSGVYDPASPSRIRWDGAPELDVSGLGAAGFPGLEGRLRISSFAEANGVLYAAIGQTVYARIDGAAAQWRLIYTNPRPAYSQTGLRGLTAIPGPPGGGQLLLAAIEGNRSRIVRIDPQTGTDTTDLDLGGLLDRSWATRVSYVIGAYNDMAAVPDPRGGTGLLIGIEAFIPPPSPRPPGHDILPVNNGLEAGAWYLFRHADGQYDLHRIDASLPAIGSSLVATRAVVPSPFDGDSRTVFFAGYDANGAAAHDTAWIVHTDLATALTDGAR